MYAVLARYYDLIHDQLKEDLDFGLSLAGESDGPILELGCGTGRLLVPLVKAGYMVTGVDNEQLMLQRAKARLDQEKEEVRSRATLIGADICSLTLASEENSYGLALFPYNTLFHFQTHEIRQSLPRIKRYLKQDGRLFIDVANPFIIEGIEYENYPVLENTFSLPATGEKIVQKSRASLDLAEQCLHVTWYFETYKDMEQHLDTATVEVDYRYYFPHELELLLHQCGFQLEQTMGDYDRSPFNEESRRLLIFAHPSI